MADTYSALADAEAGKERLLGASGLGAPAPIPPPGRDSGKEKGQKGVRFGQESAAVPPLETMDARGQAQESQLSSAGPTNGAPGQAQWGKTFEVMEGGIAPIEQPVILRDVSHGIWHKPRCRQLLKRGAIVLLVVVAIIILTYAAIRGH